MNRLHHLLAPPAATRLMRATGMLVLALAAIVPHQLHGARASQAADVTFRMVWDRAPAEGRIEVRDGRLDEVEVATGEGTSHEDAFRFKDNGPGSLLVRVADVDLNRGAGATSVTLHVDRGGFSFLARDVSQAFPIFRPSDHVAITTAEDPRSYREIAADLESRGLRTKLERLQAEPEAGFESVSRMTRDQPVPTWLGISRDNRLFKITHSLERSGLEQDVIVITRGASPVKLPEFDDKQVVYSILEGRGQGPVMQVTRRLEDGTLPILHKETVDDDIRYDTVSFVTLERSPLQAHTVRGTHFLVADSDNSGNALTTEQAERAAGIRAESEPQEELVLFLRTRATNTGDVPRYAWLKAPKPGWSWADRHAYEFDPVTGYSQFAPDRVFNVAHLDGQPLHQEEVAVLLPPGESVILTCRLPHQPLSAARAAALGGQDFDARLEECRAFWRGKLASATRIQVPEKRINEMLQAGLLHLDLVTFGLEPDGTLAPSIGVYSPIGTESAPILLFYASMGLHDQARRSVRYFLEKQREDGSMRNFADYVIETGAVLWVVGELERYAPDPAWVRSIAPRLRKACDYLIRWRARNQRPELRQRGYGMIEGKVADPNDPYHQFMLNAYAYLGLSRAAETLHPVDAPAAAALAAEAVAWKTDIRDALEYAMVRSPVVPLGDGRWGRTAPPWTEATAPRSLYVTPDRQFTHGAMTVADSLLGPMHLVFCEVLSPDEPVANELLEYHSELFLQNQTAFSQPYYSRHNWVQLQRGLVKPFLQTWYTAFSALADRETYTFWEHFYQVSAHKVHEEAWFLMETRWMLYLEDGDSLKLLAGAPRAWFRDRGVIDVANASSHFGRLTFSVTSDVSNGRINARVTCPDERMPRRVLFRLRHPEGKTPRAVEGGVFDPEREHVEIFPFTGEAHVRLHY